MAPIALMAVLPRSVHPIATHNELFSRQGTTSRPSNGDWRSAATTEDFVLESWSQGVVVGALMIMGCITVANMRRGVLLHKLILAELLLAMSHGTFCFMSFRGYGWYLSSTAMLLYFSWIIHNSVAWLKVRPFFSQPGGFFKPKFSVWTTRIYLGTLALSLPVIMFQVSNNFRFFNDRGGWYRSTRPYEPLMRDPWWIFTCIALFHVISRCYGTGTVELLRRSPRFGLLLVAIFLSIVFTACDIAASISSTAIIGQTEGINPWWKLSLVFKCLTDTIMLDDFKTELKRLGIKRIAQEEKRRNTISLVADQDSSHSQDKSTHRSRSHWRKPSQWFGTGSIARSSTAGDISPTASFHKLNYQPGEPTNATSHGTKALNNPDAEIDEVEFSTALSLDPSPQQFLDVESARGSESDYRRQPQQRHSITTHTKHLSHLPSLKHWGFEPIRSNASHRQKDSNSADTTSQRSNPSHSRSAIQSHGTDVPLSNPRISIHVAPNDTQPRIDLDDEPSPDSDSIASQERIRRFKNSIGA